MVSLEDRDLEGIPSIPEYYSGKTIFITGGTGFMGKVLIEKLLFSCTELDRIYLLLRNKKGVTPEDRLKDLYASECFDRLREQRQGVFESKVFFIAGDCSELGLGISEEDRALIVNRVNIIFHAAASVRFDDPLKFAAKLNLRGTREIMNLVKDVRNLECFVHVSTSYANTNRDCIEEIVYPPLSDWRNTLEICETLDDHTLQILTPKYLGEMPNTYGFTKQLAENVVFEYQGKLPIVIIRPSIVISSYMEPAPGWLENFNGPVGIMVATGKGILRTLYSNPDLVSDYMPVDIAIKGFIVASWIRGTKKLEPLDDIAIYNSCQGQLNTMTTGEVHSTGRQIATTYPLNNMLWTIDGSLTTSRFIYNLKVLLYHVLPALVVDALLWMFGHKPMLLKLQRRIYIANTALQYYITKQWTFSNKNFVALRSTIKEEDKNQFYYDMEKIDKYEYFVNCCKGGKKYLLKEKEEDLPKARAHHRRIIILDRLITCLFYGYIFWRIIQSDYVQSLLNDIGV